MLYIRFCYIIIIMRNSGRRWKRNKWQPIEKRRRFDINKFLAGMLVVTLPVMIICLSANVLMRMGDVYKYSLDSSGIMDSTTLRTTKNDVVDTISKYMQHRTDELSLVEDAEIEPVEIFGTEDREAMGQARTLLDIMLVVGTLALIASAIAYFLLIRWRVKDVFMKRFKVAFAVTIAVEALNYVVVAVEPVRRIVFGHFIRMDFPDGDNLVLLLTDDFPGQVAMFEAIMGTVLMLILAYFTWSVAGRRKMFKRR